ncbi:D-xylose-proton symporter-like [Armigeres subalbatus]|uniref:D-xylose-proton symporter-like n=1 Tax=Armigeres subalbatus TaxID=124917 RepID=UPI002ED3E182
MGRYADWCRMTRKNKMQTNSLLGAIVTLMLGGVYVGSSIFNIHLRIQGWAKHQTDGMILLVVNLFYIGAVVGSFLGAALVDRMEKLALSRFYFVAMGLACILQVILPKNIILVGFARGLAGISHGMAYLIVLLHGGEVLTRELRGVTIAAVNYIMFIGILSHGTISPIVLSNYYVQPVRIFGIIGVLSILMAVAIGQFMSIESPIFLVRNNRDAEAIRTLMKLRSETMESFDVRNAFAEIKDMLREDSNTSCKVLADGNWFPLLLTCVGKIGAALSFNAAVNRVRLAIIDQVFCMNMYCFSAIVIIAIRCTIGIIAVFTVDKYGRKPQQAISTFLSGAILTSVGVVYLITEKINRTAMVVVLLIYDAVACIGVTQVPDVHLSEAFPTTKKNLSIALVLTVECAAQVMMLSISYWWDYSNPDIYGPILLACGLPMIMISIFLYQILPETAKLSLRNSRAAFARNEAVFKVECRSNCSSISGYDVR